MPIPKRPRDRVERAKLVFDMLTGEAPNDKDQVLGIAPEDQATRACEGKSLESHSARRSTP